MVKSTKKKKRVKKYTSDQLSSLIYNGEHIIYAVYDDTIYTVVDIEYDLDSGEEETICLVLSQSIEGSDNFLPWNCVEKIAVVKNKDLEKAMTNLVNRNKIKWI